MGIETAALIMGGIAVAGEVGKSVFEVNAANSQEKALDIQSQQAQLETQQKTLQNYDVMEKVLEAQQAHMTTTGTAFSSPSFNAMQRNTMNIAARKQSNIDIESDLAETNIDIEKKNVRSQLYAQLFGNAADAGMSAFSAYSKMPTKMPQLEDD